MRIVRLKGVFIVTLGSNWLNTLDIKGVVGNCCIDGG